MSSISLLPTGRDLTEPEGAGVAMGAGSAALGRKTSQLWAPRRVSVWAVSATSSLALAAVGRPALLAPLVLAISGTFAAAAASPASGENRGWPRASLTVVAALPAGLVLTFVWALTVGLIGGIAKIPIWADRGGALISILGVIVGTGIICWGRGGRVPVVGPDRTALSGALLLSAAFTWIVTTQPFELWSRGMATGTDFLRHVGMVREAGDAGFLEPGAVSYPQAFHATAAWLSASSGLESDSQTLWRAAHPLALTMLVIMLFAVMAIAGRATRLLVGGNAWPIGASIVAGTTFVQTAWFSTFLEFGNVMNMVVGVSLLAMLLAGLAVRPSSLSAAAIIGGGVAVTSNAWQLLAPVAALGCLPWAAHFLRQNWRDFRQWALWTGMALLTFHGLLGVRTTSVAAAASVPTVSNLFNPEWWWFVALGLSVLAAAMGWRRGATQWGASAFGMVAGIVALTAYLLRTTGSSWELMLYYPVKAMWTGMVVLIPLAAAGAAWLVASAWRYAGSRRSVGRLATQCLIVGLLALLVAGSVGRGFAFRPHLVVMATGGTGMPNWAMSVIDSMEGVSVPEASREGALVMGVVPSTDVPNLVGGFIGMADYLAMESLSHLGMSEAAWAAVKSDLARRDTGRICRYLRNFPESVRITGPNPAAGPGWLVDSGCPTSVVQPQRWLVLDVDPAWYAGSTWQDKDSWTYPTVGEYRAAVGSR